MLRPHGERPCGSAAVVGYTRENIADALNDRESL
jgi:hypothetical protein